MGRGGKHYMTFLYFVSVLGIKSIPGRLFQRKKNRKQKILSYIFRLTCVFVYELLNKYVKTTAVKTCKLYVQFLLFISSF